MTSDRAVRFFKLLRVELATLTELKEATDKQLSAMINFEARDLLETDEKILVVVEKLKQLTLSRYSLLKSLNASSADEALAALPKALTLSAERLLSSYHDQCLELAVQLKTLQELNATQSQALSGNFESGYYAR